MEHGQAIRNFWSSAVVVGVLGMLGGMVLLAAAPGTQTRPASQTQPRATCATNLRSIGIVTAYFAANHNDRLPESADAFEGTWLCDMGKDASDAMVKVYEAAGTGDAKDMAKKFYCPANAGQDAEKMWNAEGKYRMIGYIWMAERSTQTQEKMPDLSGVQTSPPLKYYSRFINTPFASRTMLAADWLVSDKDKGPDIQWTGVKRAENGARCDTSHAANGVPEGQNVLCFDGHIEWRKFDAKATDKAVAIEQGGKGAYLWMVKP